MTSSWCSSMSSRGSTTSPKKRADGSPARPYCRRPRQGRRHRFDRRLRESCGPVKRCAQNPRVRRRTRRRRRRARGWRRVQRRRQGLRHMLVLSTTAASGRVPCAHPHGARLSGLRRAVRAGERGGNRRAASASKTSNGGSANKPGNRGLPRVAGELEWRIQESNRELAAVKAQHNFTRQQQGESGRSGCTSGSKQPKARSVSGSALKTRSSKPPICKARFGNWSSSLGDSGGEREAPAEQQKCARRRRR